jgi:hypothetical protein
LALLHGILTASVCLVRFSAVNGARRPSSVGAERAAHLLDRYGRGFRTRDRFFVSELGRFARFRGVVAGAYRVLLAGFMSAFVALFGSGPMALGRPFVMIRGIDVGIFRHGMDSFSRRRSACIHRLSVHEGAQQGIGRDGTDSQLAAAI